eukprot:6123468-Prymnesium_polylepis.2
MAHDFALFAHAPALLSSTSTMSFIAGFYGAAGEAGTFRAAARVHEPRARCGGGKGGGGSSK